MGDFLQVLPLAFVMIAGPQIISSVFLATSEGWRRNSLALIGGAAVAITSTTTVAFFVVKALKSSASPTSKAGVGHAVDWVILGLLLFAAVYVFLKRKQSEPPKWMGKLQDATLKFSLILGVALLGAFPTDIVTSATVGAHVARDDDPWWHVLGFVLMTLFLLSVPVLLVVLLGARGRKLLPKVRDWMNSNSWIISELVLALFIGITINSLLSG